MTCSLLCSAMLAAATWLQPLSDQVLEDMPAPVHYYSTKPVSHGDVCTVAVVIVHGWGEDPQSPAREALTFREAACLMLGENATQPFVVAPAFPRPSMMKKWKCPSDGRAIWNTSWEGRGLNERGAPSDDWRGGGDAAGVEMSSYDVIDRMFAFFGDKNLYPNLKRVVLLGNSAGGQFAGRYAAVGKGFVRDGVEVVYMVLAPSTQFRLDDDVTWHYGLKNRPRYSRGLSRDQIYANLSTRRVWYGCGVDDVKGKPFTSLDSTPEAMLQGANRFERFLNLEKYLKAYPEWAKMTSFTPIPGIAHNGEKAYTFPPLVRFALGVCDFSWKGAALSAWTNETNSIRSYELTGEGLVVRMAHWRDACIAVDFAEPAVPGLDWEIAFRAKVVCPETGRVAPEGLVKPLFEGMRDFANSESTKFSWRADGKWHDYCVRAFNGANGRALKRLKLRLPPEGYSSGVVTFSEISVRRRPVAPEMSVMCAEADGFARPGAEVELRVRACNRGTSDAIDAKLVPSGALPGGVKWISLPPPRKVVEPGEAVTFRAVLESDAARDFVVAFSLSSGGCAAKRVEVPVKIGKAPVAGKSAGVPEPCPPKCAYDVAACYYPGWIEPERWKRIERVAPERKPLLGWYDEANPEVIDWQIKWYAEHGIGVLMLDWYWTQGNLRLDHFVQAYKKARWRKYLKWMVVWCNESQKPIHTPEDNRRVTKYWIDNYFCMDEYYRIDDEPVVGIFVLDHYIRDFGEAATAKMLEESRQMARDAGYKGIHFVVFMRPEDDVGAIVPRRFLKLGASSFAHYNPHSAAGRGESFDRYSWKSAIEFNAESWRLRDRSGVPFWPVASSGWDDRPWNGRCEVYGRSAADFRKLLSEMKEFADSTGRKRVMVGPINEWGEGSYIEPCRQFGFSMYDAIRDVFCEKPPEGWPENLVPSDVGLGPYDFKETVCDPKASVPMDFRDGGTHGWKPMQGHVKEMRPGSDGLHVVPVGPTPGIFCDYQPFEAGDFGRLKVRLKVLGDKPSGGNLKVYWRSEGRQWCEAAGIGTKLSIDGKWHDYELDLSSRPAWSRRIFAVRIQPSGANMPEYVIESVEFLRK